MDKRKRKIIAKFSSGKSQTFDSVIECAEHFCLCTVQMSCHINKHTKRPFYWGDDVVIFEVVK